MKAKLLNESGERTGALVFDIGDSVMANLGRFAREQELRGAHFSGIGAFRHVILRYFDWQSKQNEDIPVEEQVEVLTLTGNVAREEGEPKVHAHLIVGRRDGSILGGHLKEAHVHPTLEIILTEEPEHLVRRYDEATGLALIDL